MTRFLTACLLLLLPVPGHTDDRRPVFQPPTVSTFSIVAIDPSNGDLGVAVASRYFSVGSVVPWALAGVGTVATQANVNVGYGPRGIDLLRQGLTAKQVLDKLLAEQNFSNSDRANPTSAAKLGKILGVDAIIVGSITQFGGENQNMIPVRIPTVVTDAWLNFSTTTAITIQSTPIRSSTHQ